MNTRVLVIGTIAALALPGCGPAERHSVVAPAPPVTTVVREVEPASRSLHVAEDIQIQARFAVPLDPTTVNARTVFLKLDYARLPIDVAYVPAETTIHIVPRDLLRPGQTYTVEITPAVQGQGGAILDATYFWQFTTRGVRRPRFSLPADRTQEESPFVMLSWDSTDVAAGTIRYDVYAATDSVQVATRLAARLARVSRAFVLPRASWGNARRWYWSVTVSNLTTGESVDGPVWWFTTLAADAQVDSIFVALEQAGYLESRAVDPVPRCGVDFFSSGPSATCVLRWGLSGLPTDLRLQRATMRLGTNAVDPGAGQVRLWATTQPWIPCVIGFPGPPYADQAVGALAQGVASVGGVAFSADPLTAHVEAQIRHGTFPGYLVTSTADLLFTDTAGPMRLVIRYYRR